MSETRLQNDYNEKGRECDLFVSLFSTKTGKFTEEEFDVAHSRSNEIAGATSPSLTTILYIEPPCSTIFSQL